MTYFPSWPLYFPSIPEYFHTHTQLILKMKKWFIDFHNFEIEEFGKIGDGCLTDWQMIRTTGVLFIQWNMLEEMVCKENHHFTTEKNDKKEISDQNIDRYAVYSGHRKQILDDKKDHTNRSLNNSNDNLEIEEYTLNQNNSPSNCSNRSNTENEDIILNNNEEIPSICHNKTTYSRLNILFSEVLQSNPTIILNCLGVAITDLVYTQMNNIKVNEECIKRTAVIITDFPLITPFPNLNNIQSYNELNRMGERTEVNCRPQEGNLQHQTAKNIHNTGVFSDNGYNTRIENTQPQWTDKQNTETRNLIRMKEQDISNDKWSNIYGTVLQLGGKQVELVRRIEQCGCGSKKYNFTTETGEKCTHCKKKYTLIGGDIRDYQSIILENLGLYEVESNNMTSFQSTLECKVLYPYTNFLSPGDTIRAFGIVRMDGGPMYHIVMDIVECEMISDVFSLFYDSSGLNQSHTNKMGDLDRNKFTLGKKQLVNSEGLSQKTCTAIQRDEPSHIKDRHPVRESRTKDDDTENYKKTSLRPSQNVNICLSSQQDQEMSIENIFHTLKCSNRLFSTLLRLFPGIWGQNMVLLGSILGLVSLGRTGRDNAHEGNLSVKRSPNFGPVPVHDNKNHPLGCLNKPLNKEHTIPMNLTSNLLASSSNQNGPLHILILGNPGLGKSLLLQKAKIIMPRSKYVNGPGCTLAGLTVAISNTCKNTGNNTVITCGALPLSNHLLLDEIDKLQCPEGLFESMDGQPMRIAKAGVCLQIKQHCNIIAVGNDVKKNKSRTLNQIVPIKNKKVDIWTNLSMALLNRFDLIFYLSESVHKEYNISEQILGTYYITRNNEKASYSQTSQHDMEYQSHPIKNQEETFLHETEWNQSIQNKKLNEKNDCKKHKAGSKEGLDDLINVIRSDRKGGIRLHQSINDSSGSSTLKENKMSHCDDLITLVSLEPLDIHISVLKKYLQHASVIEVTLSTKAREILEKYWLNFRKGKEELENSTDLNEQSDSDENDHFTPGLNITIRTLNSLVKLTRSFAKLRLSNIGSGRDASLAIQMFNFSYIGQTKPNRKINQMISTISKNLKSNKRVSTPWKRLLYLLSRHTTLDKLSLRKIISEFDLDVDTSVNKLNQQGIIVWNGKIWKINTG